MTQGGFGIRIWLSILTNLPHQSQFLSQKFYYLLPIKNRQKFCYNIALIFSYQNGV